MTIPTVDTVVFDVGNVLIPFNPRWLFRKMMPDDASIERFFEETGFNAWNTQMDAGRCFADGIAAHSQQYPHHRPLFEAFFHRWQETIGEPIVESIDLFRTLQRRGVRTYLLTNFSAETYPLAVVRFPFLSDFDGAVVSGLEGLVKPDPAIYQRLLQRYAITPSRAVFIDDKLENVEAARHLGLHGIHFIDPPSVRIALRALGLSV
ncbi:HAD family hydrolase [Propionivibrio sp.]|uniref:HAD family hydrolase n=1 Tax=Propionivibrio sp. TaxID=2212460 RepID=UPI003BF371F1